MAQSDVHPVHRFQSWQVWPGSFDNPPADGNFPVPRETGLKIDECTPIASIGSCFAREIKRRLIQRGYNYVAEETQNPAAIHASAAWERVYNTFCLRQIFEYTFEDRSPTGAGGFPPVPIKFRTLIVALFCTTVLKPPRPILRSTGFTPDALYKGLRC